MIKHSLATLILLHCLFLHSAHAATNREEIIPITMPAVKVPVFAKNVYKIESFGAIKGGKTLCTKAIQKAIDQCSKDGGGRVLIPNGTWLSGTIVMKNNVDLHLEAGAILLASTSHDDYPTYHPQYRSHKDINGFNALIYAEQVENIAITGKGMIDGQGKLQKPRKGKQYRSDRDGRPRNILFVSCKTILISEITMRNSGLWNQHYLNCEDTTVDGINVYNHSNRNNDGIDIDGCRRFILTNSTIDSDDDGICLKSTGLSPCEYVSISHCTVSSHCNAIKLGTESSGGFKNILISHCTVKPSKSKDKVVFGQKNGITGITIGCVDGGTCENINVNNITIEGTRAPIFVRLGSRNRPHIQGAKVNQDGTMKNIFLSKITATGCSDWGCAILGLPKTPIKNLQLHDINITFAGGGTQKDKSIIIQEKLGAYPQPTSWGKLPAYGFFIRNVETVTLENITLKTTKLDMRLPYYLENIDRVMMKNLTPDKMNLKKVGKLK